MSLPTIKPDAIARLRLKPTHEGGRISAIPTILLYRCPVFFGDQREHASDCVFLFGDDDIRPLPDGSSVIVPVKFLSLESVGEKLFVGATFVMSEGRELETARSWKFSAELRELDATKSVRGNARAIVRTPAVKHCPPRSFREQRSQAALFRQMLTACKAERHRRAAASPPISVCNIESSLPTRPGRAPRRCLSLPDHAAQVCFDSRQPSSRV